MCSLNQWQFMHVFRIKFISGNKTSAWGVSTGSSQAPPLCPQWQAQTCLVLFQGGVGACSTLT